MKRVEAFIEQSLIKNKIDKKTAKKVAHKSTSELFNSKVFKVVHLAKGVNEIKDKTKKTGLIVVAFEKNLSLIILENLKK